MLKVSVIIPTLNEEGNIEGCIQSVVGARPGSSSPGGVEIIVADGGSTDTTRYLAERACPGGGVSVVTATGGRGAQMDAATRHATGDIFLFLHADTRLPENWYEKVKECMRDGETVVGGFTLKVDSESPWFRLLERAVRFRSNWYGLIYGDQALFTRREAFTRAGGFRKLPLMEDVDCVNRLRRLGKLCVLNEKVTTSPRRWDERGFFSTTFKNWFFLLLYYLGVSPVRLYKWYYSW